MGGFVMFDRDHAPGCADCALYRRSLVALLAAFNAGVLITNDEAAPEQIESLFGLLEAHTSAFEFARNVGWMWLAVGVGGLVFRVLQLWVLKDLTTGLVWATKIITDPFHDIMLYHKAPLALLRGEMMDPGHHEGMQHKA